LPDLGGLFRIRRTRRMVVIRKDAGSHLGRKGGFKKERNPEKEEGNAKVKSHGGSPFKWRSRRSGI